MKRRGICHCCKRDVAFRFAVGNRKARARHKCTHGNWCAAGEMPNALHCNWPTCRECGADRLLEDAYKSKQAYT